MAKFKILLAGLCFVLMTGIAPAQNVKQLQETANAFMRSGDYANAILVLNRATQLQPNNIEITKELGLNYYFAKDYAKALEIYKPLLNLEEADDQCFQVAADIYLAMDNSKECDKVYRKGLKKFPNSGPLYNELGELLWGQKDYTAIKQWEKGIEVDPGFSMNYYNASKYYYFSTDKVWSLLYGEIFLNIDPRSTLAPEIKNILLEGYKKLFANVNLETNNTDKSSFVSAFLQTMNKQSNIAAVGINTESLTMIRARFILDWYTTYGTQYPFKLFELQQQLLQEGMFDAYDQWIFTAAQNLPEYENWTAVHATEYNELQRFQTGRIFKIPVGQYYRLPK
jgi:tetratricopeptide (TPR) repeat protein